MTFATMDNIQDAGTTDTDNGAVDHRGRRDVEPVGGVELSRPTRNPHRERRGSRKPEGARSPKRRHETGQPVVLDGSALADSAGAGSFDLEGANT